MKQPIRFFSIGLFTASLIILVGFLFLGDGKNSSAEMSIDEMLEAIKSEGYRVISEDEYISLSVNSQKNAEDDNKEKESESKEEKDKEQKTEEASKEKEVEEEVHTYTLVVEPNMLGPDISKLLEENKIIADSKEFNQYLEKEGFAKYIQLGEHELNSKMSQLELAEKITKNRKP